MGAKFRLSDLPAQVVARMRPADRAALGLAAPVAAFSVADPGKDRGGNKDAKKGHRRPNKTEARYAAELLRGRDARYEAVTVRLASGHRYTPDWVVFEGGRPAECHEVKGTHRFGSHQRARLAFDQAAAEWPERGDGPWIAVGHSQVAACGEATGGRILNGHPSIRSVRISDGSRTHPNPKHPNPP